MDQPQIQEQKRRSLEETTGIPSGVSAGFKAQTAKKRAKKITADNLDAAVMGIEEAAGRRDKVT